MKKVIALLSIITLLASCATKTKIEYVDREVVKYQTKIQHDTLVQNIHDSIYYSVIQKGDTIYSTKFVYKTQYKDRVVVKIDTCFKDSIQTQTITETKALEKKHIPWWAWICLSFTCSTLALTIYRIYKWLKH